MCALDREEKVSQYDDLAFAINQEPSTAALVMHLEKAKLTAITGREVLILLPKRLFVLFRGAL